MLVDQFKWYHISRGNSSPLYSVLNTFFATGWIEKKILHFFQEHDDCKDSDYNI